MTWEDILKISTKDAVADAKRFMPEESGVVEKIEKILSKIFVPEFIQEILESPPNPKESAIRALVNRIDKIKRDLSQIVPYKILVEDYNRQIAELEDAMDKIKKL